MRREASRRDLRSRPGGEDPHASNLRSGRVSTLGQTYTITKCCESSSRQIIADPFCPLKSADNPDVIITSLKWLQDRERIKCSGNVIMPDHIHFMLRLGDVASLSDVMHSFTSHTAKAINRLNEWSGTFWQEGFYDHAIRHNRAFDQHLNYIAENAVRKRFVDSVEDWPFMWIHPEW
ncbi:uncharacterized protein METZ01_LOCUS374246 [marine metagenome]|uniref:Transposase IS200-like domain-containing protein n=1 Tax=marine metagenome TaxID=408172 RepID=A0A382TI00_9ZZZZ